METFELSDEVALNKLNEELLDGRHSPESLMHLFDILQIENAREHVISLYYKLFCQKRDENHGKPLTREQVNEVIELANALADVKIAAQHGSSEDTLKALSNPCLQLPVDSKNVNLYYSSLSSKYKNSPEDFILEREDLAQIVVSFKNFSADDRNVFELNQALATNNNDTIEIVLKSICGHVYAEENIEYYIRKLKDESPKDANQVMRSINDVNSQVAKAFKDSDELILLNQSMLTGDSSGARLHLTNVISSNETKELRRELMHRYIHRLLREGAQRKRPESEVPTWYRHDFPIGSVWTETINHRKSTTKMTPEATQMLSMNEIKEILEEENQLFDQHYKSNEESVKKSQQALRKFLEHRRKKHLAHLERQRQLAASKIQTSYRKYRHNKDTNSLKSSSAPSLSLVRKFVGVLREGDRGADELEIEEAKSRVTQLLHSNWQMDESLRELDEKIALLIRNRVNLEDVIAHKDKIADAAEKDHLRLGSTRKKDKERMENLEQLFFHLQTEPTHLANVVESHSSNSKKQPDASLIKDVLSPIFGYLTEKREQYLFARLLTELLMRDVEKMSPSDTSLPSSSVFFISQVFESLADSIDGNENQTISNELKSFLEEEGKMIVFNLNPDEVYKSMYNDDKVTIDTAMNDEKVKETVNSSIEFLAKWSEKFSAAMLKPDSIPPFLLYLCASLYDMLRLQLPATPSHDIRKLTSEFAYDVYYSHLLTNEKTLSKLAVGNKVPETAKHKLESVVQFVGFAVCNKGYGNDKWYLTSLNKQIKNIHEEFKNKVASKMFDCNLNEIYEMDEFTFYNPSNKPKLCLMQKHVAAVLKYLKNNAKVISKEGGSRIRNLLDSCKAPDCEGDRTIVLRLHPTAESPTTTQSNEAFARAKKFVVDLLLSECKGTTVPELLATKATDNSEKLHDEKYNQEKMPNIAAKQAATEKALQELESSGKVTKSDNYQAVVTDIANDIRLVTRRRRERLEQKRRLAETQRKLCNERDELKKRLTLYEEYLDTCLQNLGRTNKKSIRPTEGKTAAKVKKERKSSESNQKYTGSAEKLTKKGILMDIAGYATPKSMSKLNVEISSTGKKGVYSIALIDGKENFKNVTLDFQDLLRADYSEEDRLVVGETVSLNVPNAIEFFNKKFHNI
ncbi:hypothetical protein WR25_05717 [Diploscapter pachys]|uniref:Ras-GAP domain-containing protein n=1 Tax=Diploscapter pachys TaxID=2018661 RepID=A0A2A2LT08_9BILA|nr:hypothetical protein WR25_05717 [Diploscapter pachys]